MGIVERLSGRVNNWADRAFKNLTTDPAEQTLRVFLVRTGENDLSGSDLTHRRLTSVGRGQAVAAGLEIRELLAGESATVLARVGDPTYPISYLETAEAIARVLSPAGEVIHTDLWSPPIDFELGALHRYGTTIVMIADGTHLAEVLRDNSGYSGPFDELGCPPHGSVHQMVITFRRGAFGPGDVTRRFVR